MVSLRCHCGCGRRVTRPRTYAPVCRQRVRNARRRLSLAAWEAQDIPASEIDRLIASHLVRITWERKTGKALTAPAHGDANS